MNNTLTPTESYNEVVKYFNEYKKSVVDGRSVEGLSELYESSGFFLSILRKAFHNKGILSSFKTIISDATEKLKAMEIIEKVKIADAFIIHKQLTPGVTNSLHLVMEDQVVRLGAVSHIADELQHTTSLFPPFYVYFFFGNNSTHVLDGSIIEIRKTFGQLISQSLNNWVNKSSQMED